MTLGKARPKKPLYRQARELPSGFTHGIDGEQASPDAIVGSGARPHAGAIIGKCAPPRQKPRTSLTEKRSMPESCKDKPRVLLITGIPGIGKTTVIRRAADTLKGQRPRGFYTEEIREKGERRGFRLVNFDGRAHMIAHVDFPKTHRVGKYGVDVQVLDNAAALLRPDPNSRVYFVDEIGKMECLSERFVAAIRALISSGKPTVATIGARGGSFMAEVKGCPECELWEVTLDNRDGLPARVLAWLAERT
jgi:nucleoside-triphosphatase